MKNKFFKIHLFIILSILLVISSFQIISDQKESDTPAFLQENTQWADSILSTLTLKEQIAQLIMYPVYTNKSQAHILEIEKLVKTHGIGGIIFMQGGPGRQVKAYNYLQQASKVPLLTSIDGEWGVSMRLDSVVKFPRQLLLGAIQDNSLIEEMGAEIAKQCKLTGVHVNFAPDIDVNVNPNNPVINSRSFGENSDLVGTKGVAYMNGLQKNKIIASAKHFPGHGDTDADSHYSLPTIKHSRKRLDNVELKPFVELINNGVASVMVAHLYVPSLDKRNNRATTLSYNVVTKMLRDSLGFKGLTFTDALNMKGVANFYPVGEVDLEAFLAGNDILLFSQDVSKAIQAIYNAVQTKKTDSTEVARRCKRVLMAKKWVGLDKIENLNLSTENLHAKLNNPQADVINRKLIQNALTLVNNKDSIVPIKKLDKQKISVLSLGVTHHTHFQNTMGKYAGVSTFNLPGEPTKAHVKAVLDSLKPSDILVVGVHGSSWNASKKYGICEASITILDEIIEKHPNTIVALFANPYVLAYFKNLHKAKALVVGYEFNNLVQEYSAQLIMGGIPAKGKLPVSIGNFNAGMGVFTSSTRLKYGVPEEEGMNSETLKKIEVIVQKGINEKAFPGCQILVAKNNNIVYYKSFGHHTYEKKKPVLNTDLYDIASVTKIAASTPALMYLVEKKKLNLDHNLCDYLDDVEETDYYNLNIRRMLAHTAGLVPFIPFHEKTIRRGQLKFDVYSSVPTPLHSIEVAKDLFMRNDYKDSIKVWIKKNGLLKKDEYKYSDLGYYFYMDIIEKLTQTKFANFLDSVFYKPLGLTSLTYIPLQKFDLDEITPTENDMLFRKRLIHGYVHDPGAAMMGGIAGHAGLFSSANDLAKLFQMMLNNGEYGGEKFLSKEVIKEFVKCQFCEEDNRRGAGFDRRTSSGGPACSCVSYDSFGHTGFTGTMVWADPQNQLIYIFLSNRVYPEVESNKLLKMGIRTDIQEVVYSSIQSKL